MKKSKNTTINLILSNLSTIMYLIGLYFRLNGLRERKNTMSNKSNSAALAAKYKELVLDIQNFLESQPEGVCESPECESLMLAQSEFSSAYEEMTGKSIY